VGLRVPVDGFRKKFLWMGDTPVSQGEQEGLKEPQNEFRLPQFSPSTQTCQPPAGPAEFKGSLLLKPD